MKQFFSKQSTLILLVLATLGGVFTLGYYSGEKSRSALAEIADLKNKEVGKPQDTDFSLFWEAWNTLNQKYAGSTTPPSNERVWGAIEGLAASYGDPYTSFFPPEEAKNFEETVSGNFGGVGMEVGIREGILLVIAPLKNTPAYKAGVKAGDKIIKIDDMEASGLSVDKAVGLIRGEKGTTVVLTLSRENTEEPIKVSIVRDAIEIPTVDSELRPDGVFVLRLYNFSALSPALFRQGLREFIESGSDKLILDLRNNPGGYLEAAVDMASWFLPAGKVIVKEDFGEDRKSEDYRSKGYDVFKEGLGMVVLINGGSASASEILAGALRDHGKAILVGEKSFGKGSVQELINLPDNTSLKVTVARWLTPNGTSISGGGIKPDVEIKMGPEDEKKLIDTQLEKAAEILLKKSDWNLEI